MKKKTRVLRNVVVGVAAAPVALVAIVAVVVVYAVMAAVDVFLPEDPEKMTDEEKHRFYGYRKDW